jgi:hypothetical protein
MAEAVFLTYLEAQVAAAGAAGELAARLPDPFELASLTVFSSEGAWFARIRTDVFLGVKVTPNG